MAKFYIFIFMFLFIYPVFCNSFGSSLACPTYVEPPQKIKINSSYEFYPVKNEKNIQ